MIQRLEIVGFKRFAACKIDLAPLTILAGLNGAGKTTIIQALLLAREASLPEARSVSLNGPFGMELGSTQDVLNLHAALDASTIEFAATMDDGVQVRFRLDASDETLLHLPIELREPDRPPQPLSGPHRAFAYLCAERLGPRDVLGASTRPTEDLGVGTRGEYCAHVLDVHGLREKVASSRRHPQRQDEVDAFLKYQVEAWLSDIARPTEIDTVSFPRTTVTALRFRIPGRDWVRAPNMGFGVSYSLPIVLAGLFAPPEGGLLIVENPEAHLHPAGQSRMGTFLATMAAGGLQVVLETHSDHVLNGVRRAVGEHRLLEASSALVHFFDQDSDGEPHVHRLELNAAGNLSMWPPRFFDQYQADVSALSRVRRKPRR